MFVHIHTLFLHISQTEVPAMSGEVMEFGQMPLVNATLPSYCSQGGSRVSCNNVTPSTFPNAYHPNGSPNASALSPGGSSEGSPGPLTPYMAPIDPLVQQYASTPPTDAEINEFIDSPGTFVTTLSCKCVHVIASLQSSSGYRSRCAVTRLQVPRAIAHKGHTMPTQRGPRWLRRNYQLTDEESLTNRLGYDVQLPHCTPRHPLCGCLPSCRSRCSKRYHI